MTRIGDGPTTATAPSAATMPSTLLGLPQQTYTGNGCGTCTVAMALSYILGRSVTQAQIDALVRHADIFASPHNMCSAARQFDVSSRMVNRLTRAEVISNLEAHRPICIFSNMAPEDPKNSGQLHWRALDGYRYVGKALQLHVVDPEGVSSWQTWEDLQPTWAKIHSLGIDIGFDRFGIILGATTEDTKLGPDRLSGCRTLTVASDIVADAINGATDIAQTATYAWRARSFILPIVSPPLAAINWLLRRK
jgi:hypothetical protein